MSKNQTRMYVVLAAVLVVFLVLAFAIPFAKLGAFWVSLVFGVIAIAVQLYSYPKAFREGDSVRSKFYGFPILRITIIYLLAQLVLSFLFMATALWVPGWIALVFGILLLAVALIGFVAADAMRDEVERQDVQLKVDVTAMRSLQSLAASLLGQCEDETVAAALKTLSEEFQFSDPRSSDTLADVEADLSACMEELQRAVVDGDNEATTALCKKASLKLAERNRLCKLGKQ